MPQIDSHRIYIEGEWDIRDLYFFPHRYAEVYAFLYALHSETALERERFIHTFRRYPWRGGYSAVNFYDDLYLAIPRESRPQIKRIEYASPGFIELTAVIVLVTQIQNILIGAMKTWDKLDAIYTSIHKRAMRRKLLKLSVKDRERKLAEDDLRFIVDSTKELADAIGIKKPEAIVRLTDDPLASLKILMAFYRRLHELLFFIAKGKVRILSPNDERRLNDTDSSK